MCRRRLRARLVGMPETTQPSPTTAVFRAQAAVSFALSLGAVLVAIFYMPADPWVRAFLGLGLLYVTTSAFTLAKCVRDKQESQSVLGRIDQARLERLLAEHDPFTAA